MSLDLNDYIEKNYGKFLDYANFHAEKNGLTGSGEEILQFVLEIVLVDMDRSKVLSMLNKKYGNYNELHAYILGMIKINAFSPRSDFRRKIINGSNIDININVQRLKIADDPIEEEDRSERIFNQITSVRLQLQQLDIPESDKEIFRFKFLCGNHLSQWPGPEPKERIYKVYNQVLAAIKKKLNP